MWVWVNVINVRYVCMKHYISFCVCVCVCVCLHTCVCVSQLSEVLVEMGSNLMQVDDQILSRAQREERVCSSIVHSLETLAWPQLHSGSQDLLLVGLRQTTPQTSSLSASVRPRRPHLSQSQTPQTSSLSVSVRPFRPQTSYW